MKQVAKYLDSGALSQNLVVKDVTSKGIVTLYASAFGNVDAHKDVIEKGSYAKTIMEQGPSGADRIKHLFQHDAWNIIGKPLTMKEDDNGLLIESYVTEKENGDYRKMYQEGLITEHSIMGYVVKDEYDEENDINYIKEVKLMEYSGVTWGANPNTPVIAMKSLEPEAQKLQADKIMEQMERMTKALAKGTFTDETMIKIQIQHEQAKAVLKSLLYPEEPLQGSTRKKEPREEEPTLVDIFKNLEKQDI